MNTLNVLMLTRYGSLGASSRLRSIQYLPFLKQAGFNPVISHFMDDNVLSHRYRHGNHGLWRIVCSFARRIAALFQINRYDLVWIEKEALPWLPLWIEVALLRGVPYVLDYDDAVFHNYDQHESWLVRRWLGSRLDKLMEKSALVICGNKYLAARAHAAGAREVEIVPTVVDLNRYAIKDMSDSRSVMGAVRIVWVGSPSTVHYLHKISGSLQALSMRLPFILRVIGAEFYLSGVRTECIPWSESTEVEKIRECDIGIMPLTDSPWEQGKCGYKLIQYMACGLPVVASAVGANLDIVINEHNGFLVNTKDKWEEALERLLIDQSLRISMGRQGRCRVESNYCLQVTAPTIVRLIKSIAERNQ